MITTLLAICAAYVVLAVIVLSMGLTSRFAWWVKAGAIAISSVFFVEVFFASKSLLGWPASGALPPKFQLLWTRVVEPDPKVGHRGAIYLWVEEIDANNVPSGLPRAYRLRYSVKLAERTLKARDEIMAGNPQEGVADDLLEDPIGDEPMGASAQERAKQEQPDGGTSSTFGRIDLDAVLEPIPRVEFRPMPNPLLPPKP
jgi:hypothetical protein